MSDTYGEPPKLRAADPAEGVTLAEMAAWVAALRADGAPDDAPIANIRSNWRAGLKSAEVLTGDRLAASLKRRRERHATTDHTPYESPDEGNNHV